MLFSLLACGQFVPADQASLEQGSNTIPANTTELPDRSELGTSTQLSHYGLQALMQLHTGEATISGLQGSVDMRGVDYQTIIDSVEARLTLADTLANLAAIDPVTLDGRSEKLAYWLNLYNAWMVQAVVDQVSNDASFDSVAGADGTFALFSTPLAIVGDSTFTLNQIEHGIIRGDVYAFDNYFKGQEAELDLAQTWHDDLFGTDPVDARIHMALNCASVGCPDVLAGAYRAATLDTDLSDNATRFLDNTKKGAGPNGVSELLRWFGGDFTEHYGSLETFVQQHRTGGDADVNYDATLTYDWALNAI